MITTFAICALAAAAQHELTRHSVVAAPPHVELFEHVEPGPATFTAPIASPAGVRWIVDDNASGWVGTTVGLAHFGSEVYSEVHSNAQAMLAYSSYDADPPSALWSVPAPGTLNREVCAAEETSRAVVIHETPVPGGRRVDMLCHADASASAAWQWSFATIIQSGSRVAISSDGTRVVGAASDDAHGNVELATLDGVTGVATATRSLAVGGPLRGFDLSSDGSTLLATAGARLFVLDAATLLTRFETPAGTFLDAAAISGDGHVIALGGYNWMRVYEQVGSAWTATYSRYLAGSNYVSALDVSGDGSTVAYGFTFYDQFLAVRIEALDVSSKLLTMSESLVGSGTYQNMLSDVALSADGSHFAVGVWGDAANTVDELRVYARSNSTPLMTIDLPGSVFDVAISGDGRRVAAAGKAVHANALGNGGRIALVDALPADLELFGVPHIGASLSVEFHAPVGRECVLLTSTELARAPIAINGVGTLHLDRDDIQAYSMGMVPSTGVAQLSLGLPSAPAFAGTTLYMQARLLGPAQLSSRWLALTLVP